MKKFLACSMILTLLTSVGSVCFANPLTLDLKDRGTLDEVFDVEQLDFAVRYRLSQTFYNKAVEFCKLVDEERYEEASEVIDESLIGEEAIDLVMKSQFGQPDDRLIYLNPEIPPIVELAVEAKKHVVNIEHCNSEYLSKCAYKFLFAAEKLRDRYEFSYKCYVQSKGHNARVYKNFVEEAIQLGEKFQQISDLCSVDDLDLKEILALSTELLDGATRLHTMCCRVHVSNGDLMYSMRQFTSGMASSQNILNACKKFHYNLNELSEKTVHPVLGEHVSDLEKAFQRLSSDCQYYINLFA